MKKRICSAALTLSLCACFALPAAALDVDQARELLRKRYIAPLPPAAEQAGTVDELLSTLNDPYTVYYTAEEYAAFLDAVNGEALVGIGISIQTAFDRGFPILSILPDSPALEAGLQAGDRIIAVDGVTLTPQDNVTGLITGEEGTQVTLTVTRADGDTAQFTMTRRTVRIPIVNFENQDGVGIFDCASFGESTPSDVALPLDEQGEDIRLWVMDLRSNPGGTADSAALTATHFVGGGTMVYFRDGQAYTYAKGTHAMAPDLTDNPLIILTSPSSASASELFSAAIRDYRAGISVGQRTYGKGVAQVVVDEDSMPEAFQGDALKLTAYQFFSPRGVTCHYTGVLPTLWVEPEQVPAVLRLLSAPKPNPARDTLKLELVGQSFYLDPQICREEPDTLKTLLEALPPTAQLFRGRNAISWDPITVDEAARWQSVDYQPRTFSDLEDSPYRAAVETLARYGLVSGDGTGRFLPEHTLTRGELAVLLSSAFQFPVPEKAAVFSDVDTDAWYAPAVAAVTARGFLTGTGEGKFEPDRTLTNAELYPVLGMLAEWVSLEAVEAAEKPFTAYEWLDYYRYPEWAQERVRNLYSLGVRVDRENPDTPVTRGACVQALFEMMDKLGMFWY